MPNQTLPRNWSPFGAESFMPSTVVVVVSVWPTKTGRSTRTDR